MGTKYSTEEDGLDGTVGRLPRFANKITMKNAIDEECHRDASRLSLSIGSGVNVSPGMRLWGEISEVNEKDIVVTLPGGLRGLVRACEAFDPISHEQDGEHNILSRMYHVGQLVSCIVLEVDDKKEIANRKIWLSMRSSLFHKSSTLDVIQERKISESLGVAKDALGEISSRVRKRCLRDAKSHHRALLQECRPARSLHCPSKADTAGSSGRYERLKVSILYDFSLKFPAKLVSFCSI